MKACWTLLLLTLAVHAVDVPLNFFTGEQDAQIKTSLVDDGSPLSFRMTCEHRTLAAGTVRMEMDGVVRLSVILPELNPGVVLPLTLTFHRGGAVLETHKAWAFSKEPPVKPVRKIFHVGDARGTTAEMLEELSVVFETAQNAEAVAALTNAFIIVSDTEMWKAVLRAAEGGADVLLLASSEVEQRVLVLPPRALRDFRVGGVCEILRDKNATYELATLEGGLCLAARENEVVLLSNPDGPTAEAAQWKYDGGGRVRVCGMSLPAAWRNTPTAQWLLAEMISTGERP